jgi:hypothetical protein
LHALALLVFRDVEEQLDDLCPLVGQQLLEVADVAVAPPPHRVGRQSLDAHDEHVLVVAPVEHADDALRRRALVDTPQVVVRTVLLGRQAEAVHVDARHVDRAQHVADGAVLAATVHRLQHDQHGTLLLGEQSFLERGDLPQHFADLGLGPRLVPSKGLVWVVTGKVELGLHTATLHDIDSHRR